MKFPVRNTKENRFKELEEWEGQFGYCTCMFCMNTQRLIKQAELRGYKKAIDECLKEVKEVMEFHHVLSDVYFEIEHEFENLKLKKDGTKN